MRHTATLAIDHNSAWRSCPALAFMILSLTVACFVLIPASSQNQETCLARGDLNILAPGLLLWRVNAAGSRAGIKCHSATVS